MTESEWINAAVGKPWVDRSTGPDDFDCWGLVVDYFWRVEGLRLPTVEGYEDGSVSIASGFFQQVDSLLWVPTGSRKGVVFTGFIDDQPSHVGIVLGNHVIHAYGERGKGQVYNHPLRMMHKLFNRLEFWEYAPDN